MGPHQVLLGNVDPVRVMRDGTPETVEATLRECHRQAVLFNKIRCTSTFTFMPALNCLTNES